MCAVYRGLANDFSGAFTVLFGFQARRQPASSCVAIRATPAVVSLQEVCSARRAPLAPSMMGHSCSALHALPVSMIV